MASKAKYSVAYYYDNRDNKADVFAEIIEEVKANMRERDKEDLLDSCDDIDFALIASIQNSEEFYVYRDFYTDEILCIFGKTYADMGCIGRSIWLIGTKQLNNLTHIKNLLFKEARAVIASWVEQHGLLYNCVHEDNLKSIRYMTMLGARWLPEMTECNGKKFYNFYIAGGEQ